jgi:glycosyltransferase involved in cell wall biosynthesis
VDQKRLHDTVRFREWFSYESRAGIYDRHVAAMLTFPRSLETELSFRTRVLDYLWGGLPVFSSPAAGTDEIIRRYEAGSVLMSDRPQEIANAVVSVLGDPAGYRSMVEGTQRFVSDYQWSDLAAPLVAFCGDPKVDEHAARFVRLHGTADYSRPSLVRRALRKGRRMISR